MMKGMKRLFSNSGLRKFDNRVTDWMEKWGHPVHRLTLATVFFWFGSLKVFGFESATSLIAHTVYITSAEVMVPILGLWEIMIGVCLIIKSLTRLGLLLLAVRLPGTLLALAIHVDLCFVEFPLVPSPEGQYLIKDFLLLGAALVIGGTIREEK